MREMGEVAWSWRKVVEDGGFRESCIAEQQQQSAKLRSIYDKTKSKFAWTIESDDDHPVQQNEVTMLTIMTLALPSTLQHKP